jgi:hypothetical protein
MARKAYEINGPRKTEFEKIRAIATYVQNIQYISIQPDSVAAAVIVHTPRNEVFAKSLWRLQGQSEPHARGCSRWWALTLIQSAFTRANRNYVRSLVASPQQFNHCIIAVKVSDQTQASTIIQHPKLGRLLIFDAHRRPNSAWRLTLLPPGQSCID